MHFISLGKIVLQISLRNLFKSKIKSLIIGTILAFGTMLIVVGFSLLATIEKSMAKSIISSVSGHLQVFSSKAKDDLALFGGSFMGEEDIGIIPDFKKVKDILMENSNVKSVIPMGFNMVMISSGNEFDRSLSELRDEIKNNGQEKIALKIKKIRQLLDLLKEEYINLEKLTADKIKYEKNLGEITRAQSESFWDDDFQKDREMALQFLESHIAPLLNDGFFSYLRNLGTDPDLFRKNFDRFEIVKGEMIPEGKRGILINEKNYNEYLKNNAAQILDRIYKDVTEKGKRISKDSTVQAKIRKLVRQYRLITFQLKEEDTAFLEEKLGRMFPDKKKDINELVKEFLNVNDGNLKERYAYFYENIAPRINLHPFNIGEMITLRSYTKSGYIKARNLKVYGIFHFRGIEKSDLAGSFNLLDLVSFRELFGQMSNEDLKELEGIKKEMAVREIGREEAETALFSESNNAFVAEAKQERFNEFEAAGNLKKISGSGKEQVNYSKEELESGLALNAAIILRDPAKLEITKKEIEASIKKNNLELTLFDWKKASGIVGQFVTIVSSILITAIFIIFLVALFIINNSMILATMERIPEIGTMRALGGQSRFVLFLVLTETLFLGLFSAFSGGLLGLGIIFYLGKKGIPAFNDILVFLFSGPKLYPEISFFHLITAFLLILAVSVISTAYPAIIATRISPVKAMEHRE